MPATAPADALAGLARHADAADAGAQNNLGVVLARHGRAGDARRAFARALALDPAMALARRNLAAAAAPHEDAADERALRARVRADGGDAEAWRALVRHLSARGRHDAAREVLDRWAEAVPAHEGPAAERARAELTAGRPEAALAAVAVARASAAPAAMPVLDVIAARAVYQQGDAEGALALLDRARASDPSDADAELLRSFVLGELGATSDAAAARARAAALNPALGRADENLALGAPGAGSAAGGGAHAPGTREAVASDAPAPDAALALARALRSKRYLAEAAAALAPARRAHDTPALAREAGEVLLLAGRPAEAAEAWAAVTARAPHDAAAWLNLGVARALAPQAGTSQDAGEAFARAAQLARGTCAEAWALAGVAHEARSAGRGGEACAALLAAAAAAREASPEPRAVIAALLARALAAEGRLAEARRAGAAAERHAPPWAHAAAVHGQVLALAGAHAEAREAFARAVALAPGEAAARYGLAFAAAACGDHEAARTETARALALAPVVPTLPWPLVADVGELLVCGVEAPTGGVRDSAPLSADDARVADERLAALFGAGPDGAARAAAPDRGGVPNGTTAPAAERPDTDLAHVDALLAVGEYDRAEGAVARALARGADRSAALARAGLAYERQGFFGEALERYTEALEAGATRGHADPRVAPPDAAEPRRGRARMLAALGRWAAARAAADDAAAAAPDDARPYALLARTAAALGDDAAAVDAARAADDRAARHVDAPPADLWPAVADAWRAADDPAREAEAWARAGAANPGDARAPLARADALARGGRPDEAAAVLDALVRARPGFTDAALTLARLRSAAGAGDEAVRLLAAVAVRDPWHVDALALLALALTDVGRPGEGRRAAERALRLDGDHALAHAAAAAVAAALGQLPRASGHARRAVALEPAGEAARRARFLLAALAPAVAA